VTETKLFAHDKDIGRVVKSLIQYLGNVMMKANLKCEGINHAAGGAWSETDNSTYKVAMTDQIRDTMMLGADVTHPSLNSIEGCPSIAAIVGSVDDYGGKFLGSMLLQNPVKTDREVSPHTPICASEYVRYVRSLDPSDNHVHHLHLVQRAA
jgi:hypothetical protein